MAGYAAAKGVPAASLLIVVVGVLLLIGRLSILLGLMPKMGVVAIVVFFVPVTFMMHDFWAIEDSQLRQMQMVRFLKNTALLGSALMFAAVPSSAVVAERRRALWKEERDGVETWVSYFRTSPPQTIRKGEAMDILFLIGRILMGGFFTMMGINHFMKMKMMVEYSGAKKVPVPTLAVVGTGFLLLLGGLSIMLGYYPKIGVLLLAIHLIPVSVMMHNFWAIEDQMAKMTEMTMFMKNMALLGGALMLLAIPEPWMWSISV